MFAQLHAKRAAVHAAAAALHFHRLKLSALAAVAGILAGCAQPAMPLRAADPADSRTPVPPVSYRPATASYRPMRPSAPMPWRQQNDSVAPQPKTDR